MVMSVAAVPTASMRYTEDLCERIHVWLVVVFLCLRRLHVEPLRGEVICAKQKRTSVVDSAVQFAIGLFL